MKSKTYDNIEDFGASLGISRDRIEMSKLKTKLKKRIRKRVLELNIPLTEIAHTSGLSRTTLSGVVNGSLQSISLERLLRIAFVLDLSVDLKIGIAA